MQLRKNSSPGHGVHQEWRWGRDELSAAQPFLSSQGKPISCKPIRKDSALLRKTHNTSERRWSHLPDNQHFSSKPSSPIIMAMGRMFMITAALFFVFLFLVSFYHPSHQIFIFIFVSTLTHLQTEKLNH